MSGVWWCTVSMVKSSCEMSGHWSGLFGYGWFTCLPMCQVRYDVAGQVRIFADNKYKWVYRSASLEIQNLVALRLVESVDHPNLLLDQGVQWMYDPHIIPRLNVIPVGWNGFQLGDRETARNLRLPIVGIDEGHHLYILATGSYGINRGQVALTAAREFELKQLRAAGGTGSLSNYNLLASEPPQSTPVLYFTQQYRPDGFRPEVYGDWPADPVLVLKCQMPSSHQAAIRRNLR